MPTSMGNFLIGRVVTGPAHFVMERKMLKMLKTIKHLVERGRHDAPIG